LSVEMPISAPEAVFTAVARRVERRHDAAGIDGGDERSMARESVARNGVV